MANIICSINESVSGTIQSMPKVYFCCHPDDFEEYFEKTRKELHKIYPKISFWYYDKNDAPEIDEINQMNLMVIIITNRFLAEYKKGRYSCYKALKQAEEMHIPQLPLLQEGVPEESYSSVFGHSQYLSKANGGSFAIPYEEKLKKRLSETLLNDEDVKQIEDAFVAIVFLSYRKKDRKFVNKIMELIHSNEKYRDVGIWYDEFLTPGEKFDTQIEDILVNSDSFVLMVTSNLLEKDNYVIKSEYPKALEHNLPIISIQCAKTDKKTFQDIFQQITDLYAMDDVERIGDALGAALKDKVIDTNADDPRHLYLMGIAYLYGVDVEKNSNRAIELLTKSAELGCNEAYERLTAMYHNGDGIKSDPEEEIVWQRKYVEKLKEELSDENSKIKLLQETQKLAECIFGRLKFDQAKTVYKEALELVEQLKCTGSAAIEMYEYEIYSGLGDSIRLKASDLKKEISDAEVQEAKEYYEAALELCGNDSLKQAAQYSNLAGLYYQIAELIEVYELENKGKMVKSLEVAEDYCKMAFVSYNNSQQDSQSYDVLLNKTVLLDKFAGIYRLRENYEETLKHFKESLDIWEKFKDDYRSSYHEEGYALARYNYAETLYNLGRQEAEEELIQTAKLVGSIKDKKGGLTGVGLQAGYKVNALLTEIYKGKNPKKHRNYSNAMEKYGKTLGKIGR